MKPKCPKCEGTEFSMEVIEMTKDPFYFSPVCCKNCGTIVGQMIEPQTREAIADLKWIPTLIKALDDVIHPLVHPPLDSGPDSRKA